MELLSPNAGCSETALISVAAPPTASREAFTWPLIPTGYQNGLNTFEATGELTTNYIVRAVENNTSPATSRQEKYEQLEQRGESLGKHLQSLRSAGVPIASTFFVVGDSRYGHPALYMATRKIDDDNVFDQAFKSPEDTQIVKPQFETLFTALSRYFRSCIESDEPFLDDIDSLPQYVFGRSAPSEEPQFYLVDTEPRTKQPDRPIHLKFLINGLHIMLESMELRFHRGTVLTQPRADLASLTTLVQQRHANLSGWGNTLQAQLASGKNGIAKGTRREEIPLEQLVIPKSTLPLLYDGTPKQDQLAA